jgi:hypothetical protein
MSAINFNTTNLTLRQLLGNGLSYRVPLFQRDYSWTQDEWEDLWQDIQNTLSGVEPAHYMGYLVLQTQDQKEFDIIDGQQRLTTLSLLALAVLNSLEDLVKRGVQPEDNRRRIEQLRISYIGYLDPVTLVPRTKLMLNRNNDAFYRDRLVPLLPLPQRGLRSSEHLLRKGFEWFSKQVADAYGPRRDGAALAQFLSDLADRLFFTVITVTDELNAFKVFETLNARGVRLSPTDLLKNYLFSIVHREGAHETEIEALERRWNSMVDQLGSESFPAFLRAHWNSREKLVRESELFKTIRAATPDKGRVFELIRLMEQDVPVYAALASPEDRLWTEPQSRHVRELRMFYVRQPWPLLLAAHRRFDQDGFTDILRAVSIISFRYNVIGNLVTNEQERVYNDVARRIANGSLTTPSEVLRALAPIYVDDDSFRVAFAEKILRTTSARNKQVARYVLFAIEHSLSNQYYDTDNAIYSLEHILPENPEGGWNAFTDAEVEEAVYRLGNFTLLESSLNRDIGNQPFNEKRKVYSQSGFHITREVAAKNEEWTFERLAERQRWMARQATGIWRLSQLNAQ